MVWRLTTNSSSYPPALVLVTAPALVLALVLAHYLALVVVLGKDTSDHGWLDMLMLVLLLVQRRMTMMVVFSTAFVVVDAEGWG